MELLDRLNKWWSGPLDNSDIAFWIFLLLLVCLAGPTLLRAWHKHRYWSQIRKMEEQQKRNLR